MAGYANRVVRIGFPHLTEPDQPELFVTIKNPRVIPPDEFAVYDMELDANGVPVDKQKAAERTAEIIAKLVVAWRMYDASDFQVDENGEPLDQQPLGLPATPELVRRLPSAAIRELNQVIGEAMNPQ